jgi:acyl dehydratase
VSDAPGLLGSYVKAFAGALPVPLPGRSSELTDEDRTLDDVEIDGEHLAAYNRVCGFRLTCELPPTYLHVLAFPLALRIMTERAFPFPVIGAVHIGNEIAQRRPVSPDERLSVRVHADGMESHDRGTQFTLAAEARVGDEVVWESRNLYLHREGGGGGGGKKGEGDNPFPARSHWKVPGDIGRRYAAVSGDRNPIHLYPLTARLFGMPRPIAHGMWVKARCLAELEPSLPDAFTVSVRFKLPLFLPAQVAFGTREEEFEVRDAGSGKPHLSGELAPGP